MSLLDKISFIKPKKKKPVIYVKSFSHRMSVAFELKNLREMAMKNALKEKFGS